MLKRPSLLLNPWAIRSTETSTQDAQSGDEFSRRGENEPSSAARPAAEQAMAAGERAGSVNIDYLAEASIVQLNLLPDEQGNLSIPLDLLTGRVLVHVVAVDPLSTSFRRVPLPPATSKRLDLRLADGLNPELHFTQQKQVSILTAGDEFTMPDIVNSRFAPYDSLSSVYDLFITLTGDAKLIEFNFINSWHETSSDEKRELYSKNACHELNFYLFKKDPEFFRTVILPYLAYKKDKTFLDRWLLGESVENELRPWQYSQLNIVEQILLARRIEGEEAYTSTHVRNLYALNPTSRDQFVALFQVAIQGESLDTEDRLNYRRGVDRNGRAATAGVELHELYDLMPEQVELRSLALSDEMARKRSSGAEVTESAPVLSWEQDSKRYLGQSTSSWGTVRGRGGAMGGGGFGSDFDAGTNRTMGEFFDDDIEARLGEQQLFRQIDKTQEWVENNYYQIPIQSQVASLIDVNQFWVDYAGHRGDTPFYSSSLAQAAGNFSEMMFALAVLDLPVKPAEHETEFVDRQMRLIPKGPMIVFHEEIKPSILDHKNTSILVSQNFFRHGDRYRQEDGKTVDKFVTDEFLTHVPYGCQVVVTNPTSSLQKIDLLLQIPDGSMPIAGGKQTQGIHLDLEPYHTQTFEYQFYFPATGDFQHYPVHVSRDERLLAFAEAQPFHVVDKLSQIDKESWAYVSQFGSDEEVLQYLRTHNLLATDLSQIAFRMQDKGYFTTILRLLAQRHAYNPTLWSYGIKHDDVTTIREYLQFSTRFANQCGPYVDCKLVTLDPVVRREYEHLDYRPLINARAHQLGNKRTILNDRFLTQYRRLMSILSCQHPLDPEALMAVTYYLLLQDRYAEALEFFGKVDPDSLDSRLQYDYFAAYLHLLQEQPEQARGIAQRYTEYPVDRWRDAFASLVGQVDEIEGGEVKWVDTEDTRQKQTQLADRSPSFDFQVDSKQVKLDYRNLDEVQVNYYVMDLELLFSRNPFVSRSANHFSHIRPNSTERITLEAGGKRKEFPLPESLHTQNVLVEVRGGGQSKQQTYFAHALSIQTQEQYGQLQVTHQGSGRPISKVYVKAYARLKNGQVKFYKDGYTDLRGRFDYASLSTNELDNVDRFALLVMSEQHGAIVQESRPPQQ